MVLPVVGKFPWDGPDVLSAPMIFLLFWQLPPLKDLRSSPPRKELSSIE